MYKIVKDLKTTRSIEKRRGTILFIAATLLQREFVESLVPLQSLVILTFLHSVENKANTVVSEWDEAAYHQAMKYIGIDLVIELSVFAATVLVLRRLCPELSSWRILSGLIRTNATSYFMVMLDIWMFNLLIQSTFFGVDPTLRFEWLRCDGKENSTWIEGFNWEC